MTDNNILNVQQAVPFFMVDDMQSSLLFYVEQLGFQLMNKWEPEGKIEWCLLQREKASLMLQEYKIKPAVAERGQGVCICFICADALKLYREFRSRGVQTSQPFVGNSMWVVEMQDPDGYKLLFESATQEEEGKKWQEG